MRNPSKQLINAKKLALSKETLRHLCDQELVDVAGGAKTNHCTTVGSPTATCTSGPTWHC